MRQQSHIYEVYLINYILWRCGWYFIHSFLTLPNKMIIILMCIVMPLCHTPATRWHCVKILTSSGGRREKKKSERPHRPAASFLPLTVVPCLCLIRRHSQRHAASPEDPGEPRRSRPAGTHRGPAGQHLLQTRKGKDRRSCKSAVILNDANLEAKLRAQCRPWLWRGQHRHTLFNASHSGAKARREQAHFTTCTRVWYLLPIVSIIHLLGCF